MKTIITGIAFFFAICLVAGCKSETTVKKELEDSLYQASRLADTPQIRNPTVTAPTVTSLPASDSLQQDTSPRILSTGELVPRTPAPVHFKFITKTETAVPRLDFFVISADRFDSTVTLQCVVMNRVGKTNSVEEQEDDRITVSITKDQFAKASLLNNQTGERRHPEIRSDIQKSVKWVLNQADTKSFTLTFKGVPAITKSVTLIIPDFVTVPTIILPPL